MKTCKTKTTANFRAAEKIQTVKLTIPAGVSLTYDEFAPVKKFMGYNFRLCQTKFGKGWIADHLLVEEFVEKPNVYEPHLSSLKFANPKTANVEMARAYPIDRAFHGATYEDFFKIVQFLDVTRSLAFQRTKNGTMCNVAAYQFAHQMGVFIPRVWWHNPEKTPQPVILGAKSRGGTVREMTANDLFDWFIESGSLYGWRQTDNPKEDCKTHLTICITDRTPIGHIAVLTPDFCMWQAGAKNTESEPPNEWKRWAYSPKNNGVLFFTQKPN